MKWCLGFAGASNGGLALYAALTDSFTMLNAVGGVIATVCIALLLTEGRSP